MGDASADVPMTQAKMEQICEDVHTHFPDNCSGGVKYFAQQYPIDTTDFEDKNANGLVDYFDANWKSVDTEAEAQKLADSGRFVVAGRKDTPNGHVIVILPGGMKDSGGYEFTDRNGKTQTAQNKGKYPRACSTASGHWPGAKSKGEKSAFDPWGSQTKYQEVDYWVYPTADDKQKK